MPMGNEIPPFAIVLDSGFYFGFLIIWSLVWFGVALHRWRSKNRQFGFFYSLTPSLFLVATLILNVYRQTTVYVDSIQQSGVPPETAVQSAWILGVSTMFSFCLAAIILVVHKVQTK